MKKICTVLSFFVGVLFFVSALAPAAKAQKSYVDLSKLAEITNNGNFNVTGEVAVVHVENKGTTCDVYLFDNESGLKLTFNSETCGLNKGDIVSNVKIVRSSEMVDWVPQDIFTLDEEPAKVENPSLVLTPKKKTVKEIYGETGLAAYDYVEAIEDCYFEAKAFKNGQSYNISYDDANGVRKTESQMMEIKFSDIVGKTPKANTPYRVRGIMMPAGGYIMFSPCTWSDFEEVTTGGEDEGDPDQPGGGEEGGDPDQPGGGEEGGEEGGDPEPDPGPTYQEVVSLAALKASSKGTYKLTGEATITNSFQNNGMQYIYLQDQTGAILLEFYNNEEYEPEAYDIGAERLDVITDVIVEVELGWDGNTYVGRQKATKVENPTNKISEPVKMTPKEIWDMEEDSKNRYWVKLDSVYFAAGDAIAQYDERNIGYNGDNYQGLLWVKYNNSVVGKTPNPDKYYSITAVLDWYDDWGNGWMTIIPLDWSDFVEIGDKASEPDQPEEPTVTEVATIAEWLDLENENKEVLFTGMAHVQYTQRVGDEGFTTFKHFVQDEAGSAIVLYEYGTQTIQENNWIKNIKGAWEKDPMTEFRSVTSGFEAEEVAFWDAPWETPAALEATLSDLENDDYYQENQAKLISLKDCFFHEEGKFEGNKLYNISQGTEDNAKTLFYVPAGSALIGLDIPKIGDTVNMTGVLYEQLTDFSYVTPIVVPYYNKLVVRPALSEEAVEVATIEELKDLPNGQNFLYTGTARITMVKGDMLWLQDASGALRFTKEDHGFERNQGITNINGKLLADNAIDNANFDEAELATENVPVIEPVDMSEEAKGPAFLVSAKEWVDQLVVIKNVSFSLEGELDASTNGIILDGDNSASYMVFVSNYFGFDYTKAKDQKFDIYGILTSSQYLSPRDAKDIVAAGETPEWKEEQPVSVGSLVSMGKLGVYPVPARDRFVVELPVEQGDLYIYSESGSLVRMVESIGAQYVVEGLKAGVYALVFRNAQGVYSAKAVVL